MKMLIKIDEERVRADGIYDLEDMWRLIGKTFLEWGCTAERQADGSMLYSGTETNDYFTAIGLAVFFLGNATVVRTILYEMDMVR